ncbi:MAG: hypothetical protein ISS13_01550 [Actinobacteria bacterium]|nr:hypothetical protein [Actinomycetota bacterium]
MENHEKRITAIEGKKTSKSTSKNGKWYKPSSTIEKVVLLAEEGFFNVPRNIGKIVSELKTKDYHLKASDLTLPLRKIVRKGILRRTNTKSDGSSSKNWLYMKI